MKTINNDNLRNPKAKLKPPATAEIPPVVVPKMRTIAPAKRTTTGRKNAKARAPKTIAVMSIRFMGIKICLPMLHI